jgi:hypothetical protein
VPDDSGTVISRIVRRNHDTYSQETCDAYGWTFSKLPRKDREEIIRALQGDMEPDDAPRFQFLDDVDLEAMEPPEWLIQDILQEGSLAALFGPPGAGKSFLVLDWAMCVETGINWAGSRKANRGHVVYVLAEGASTLGPRITAWKDYFGAAGPIGVSFATVPVALMEPATVWQFINDLQDQLDETPALVIFDTLARCMNGGDENSARDMGALIAGADQIRKALGCAVLLVHHTNKSGESERGSTALRGAVDTLLKVKKSESGIVTLECEKHKDAPDFRPIELEMKPHRESVILTAISSVAVDADRLTPGELETLQHLAVTALSDGMSTTAWMNVADKKERTFYNHRKRLVDGGYVLSVQKGGATRYVVSNKGEESLEEYCHGTAI